MTFESQIEDLNKVKGQIFPNNFSPNLHSKLVEVYPEKGYCTYINETTQHNLHKMPIWMVWNCFFF